MWVKILTNFGDDVYISLASMDEETLLDVLLGSFDTVPDVQHLEDKDSFYMIVAADLGPNTLKSIQIHYSYFDLSMITITLQLQYLWKCNEYNYNYFRNVIKYITNYF